jgi:CO/xanthine dehydrogenase Mo-binding subunit
MDPLEFRMKNAQDAGEVTGQGMSFKSCGFKDCITTAASRSDFARKFAENQANQKKPGNIKRGIGMASMLHVGGGAKIYPSDGCGTILKMDDFANVTLITGASEIGQGSETVLSQLVCEELGLPISAITVVNNDTAITPWDVGVHASRTTFIAGNSAIGAAKKAKGKILAVAAKKFECAEADLDLRGGFVIRADSARPWSNSPSCCATCTSRTRPSW